MSLMQKDTLEYTISQDELMLKELERRDGIYSFIFHELERPKDIQLFTDSNSTIRPCHMKQNQMIIVENTDSQETKVETTHNNKLEAVTFVSSLGFSMESTSPSNCQNIIEANKLSSTTFKSTGLELSRVWNQPFSNCQSTLSSCHFLTHSKLYDFIATNSIRVRNSTPRFSNVYVPLVRDRMHPLKETANYKCCGSNNEGAPDLRALFPYDPDVHAPFVDVSKVAKLAKVEDESV